MKRKKEEKTLMRTLKQPRFSFNNIAHKLEGISVPEEKAKKSFIVSVNKQSDKKNKQTNKYECMILCVNEWLSDQ